MIVYQRWRPDPRGNHDQCSNCAQGPGLYSPSRCEHFKRANVRPILRGMLHPITHHLLPSRYFQKSDGNLVIKDKKNRLNFKKVLLPIPHSADLSDLANFEYPNDLPMPRNHPKKKEILQTGKSLRTKTPSTSLGSASNQFTGALQSNFRTSLEYRSLHDSHRSRTR